jgi:hypothetical protein
MTHCKPMLWMVLLSIVLVSYADATAHDLEAEFVAHQKTYRYVEAATDEPSCGGTWLRVYLDGSRIQKLDYSIETSQKRIMDAYYFVDAKPVLVVETTCRILDNDGHHLKHPELESKRRYNLNDRSILKNRRLADHLNYLMQYYRGNADEFVSQ